MLARIFSDAIAEVSERDELQKYLASGELSPSDIQEVIDDFVATTWKITIADRVITDVERQRLKEIVEVLAIPNDKLPADWAAVLELG